jgi:hypothetical protein
MVKRPNRKTLKVETLKQVSRGLTLLTFRQTPKRSGKRDHSRMRELDRRWTMCTP